MNHSVLRSALIAVSVTVLVLFTLAPLGWLFIMSIASPTDLVAIPLNWIPTEFDFSRYGHLLGVGERSGVSPFPSALRNSLIASVGATILALVTATLAAYAFARRAAPRIILVLMLATFMMPPITYLMPLYTAFGSLGLLNSPIALAIAYCTLLIPFATWLLTTNFDALPVEVEYAAAIEGASTMMTLRRVVLPMARPALLAAGMLSMLVAWDEFFYALLFTSDLQSKTLPVAVADLAAGRVTDYGVIAAIGVMAAIPPAIVAVLFQRHLVSGLAGGSVKG